jgi:cytoskeletal protein RodZ
MTRYCGNCGALLDAVALAGGRCLVCGAPIHDPSDSIADADTQPGGQSFGLPPPTQQQGPASRPPPARHVTRTSPGWLRSARTIGAFLLFALLVAALLAVLVQHLGVQFILTPSASSSSSSSSNSNSSSQTLSGAAATMTATTTHGETPSPTGRAQGATPTPAVSPTPGPSPTAAPSPTATPVPATLDVHPTTIQLTTCVAAQTQFTVANTGGVPFSWTATASATGYTLNPSSGTLDGGKQQVVMVSGILLSGTITVTAPSARTSPQQVTITCTL